MPEQSSQLQPNPRRVAAGRRNRRKWKGITPEGRRRLQETIHRTKPWLKATGPRTPEGKAKVALNGKKKQTNSISRRELRRDLKDARQLEANLAALRAQVLGEIE